MLTKTKRRPKKGKPAKGSPVIAKAKGEEPLGGLRGFEKLQVPFPEELAVGAEIEIAECLDKNLKPAGWMAKWTIGFRPLLDRGPIHGGSTARYPGREAARRGAVDEILGALEGMLDSTSNAGARQKLDQVRRALERFRGSAPTRRSPLAIAREKEGSRLRLDAPPSRSTAMVPVLPDLPAVKLPAPVTSTPLSAKEAKRLESCEQQIERNLRGFFEAGSALAAINQERLYRATHPTFDAYCKERWNFGRGYAYRLMDGAEIARDIATSPIGDKVPPPINEAQVRPLVKIDKADRAEVWQRAVKAAPRDRDGKPRVTAELVAFAAHRWVTPTDQLDKEAEAAPSRTAARNGKPTAEDAGERGGQGGKAAAPLEGTFEAALERMRGTVRRMATDFPAGKQVDKVIATLYDLVNELNDFESDEL